MRMAVLAGILSLSTVTASAQEPFPLAGRWTYFDFGERNPSAAAVSEACQNSWDSISPDGCFVSFSRTESGDIIIELAGFCEVTAAGGITCTYLIDVSGPIFETYTDEIAWVSQDVVDYIVRRESGKPDVDTSWTYVRCPESIWTFQ